MRINDRLWFDTEAIRTLAEILQDTGLTEIEISEKDSRIRVVRAPAVIRPRRRRRRPLPRRRAARRRRPGRGRRRGSPTTPAR